MTQNVLDYSLNPSGNELMDTYLAGLAQNQLTNHSGVSRPSYAVAGTFWIDTSTSPWVLKQFTGSADISIGTLNQSGQVFIASRALGDKNGNDITTKYVTVTGTAAKATADADGNVISSTYVKTTGTAAKATADADGNTISSTYAKLNGANCSDFSICNNFITKGTAPNSDEYTAIYIFDKNGMGWEANALGSFHHHYYPNGDVSIDVVALQPTSMSDSTSMLQVWYTKNPAETYVTFPTPPSATDNSTKGATTEWVRNHRCTTKATTTSTASADAPAYITQNYKNGKSWYRVWSDGWVEQGGYYSGSGNNKEVTLLKTMTDTNYSIMVTCKGTSGDIYVCCGSNYSSSKIKIAVPTAYDGAYWRVSGY